MKKQKRNSGLSFRKKKLEFDTRQVENVIKTKDYLREKSLNADV